jgi:hypothetical protein
MAGNDGLETAFAPAEQAVAETAAFKAFDALANGEKVPLPISRQTALEKGADVTVRFVPVEETREAEGPSSVPPPAPVVEASIGPEAETPAQVELANYARVADKALQIELAANAEGPGISTAAQDDPGPIVPASHFSRHDLPVFLLRKIDGDDENKP